MLPLKNLLQYLFHLYPTSAYFKVLKLIFTVAFTDIIADYFALSSLLSPDLVHNTHLALFFLCSTLDKYIVLFHVQGLIFLIDVTKIKIRSMPIIDDDTILWFIQLVLPKLL